ncbi:hypothetical protein AVEN_225543-1 [Araneus ventricosus]|uniref:Uncharacterized protein n=1 Tax=Araneus ventricosus TaxID=182803 RepID=A0A4Y2L5F8_ARAVE|nr:hypothetical protein AVEN_225543-1 [Araneus ventricosus]
MTIGQKPQPGLYLSRKFSQPPTENAKGVKDPPVNSQKIRGERVHFLLVISTSRFEATRWLFWDGPHSFEPQSESEDDTLAGGSLTKHPRHASGRTFGTMLWVGVQQAQCTVDLGWNRVSILEPFVSEAGTLPQQFGFPS